MAWGGLHAIIRNIPNDFTITIPHCNLLTQGVESFTLGMEQAP